MRPLRIAPRARRDLEVLLASSEDRFGPAIADRYRRLIAAALRDIRADAGRRGVSMRPDLPGNVRVYHLRHSRPAPGSASWIRRPRHFLVFREADEAIVLVRVLHDAMDLARHVDPSD